MKSPGVVIVNQAFAQKYFPNDGPMGSALCLAQPIAASRS